MNKNGDQTLPSEAFLPITKPVDGKIDAAASYKGKYNFAPSPYYRHLNLYNKKPTKTLLILDKFQTYQQTNGWSCGAASSLMTLNYFGEKDINEDEIANETGHQSPGTTPTQVRKVFEKRGYHTISSDDAPPGDVYFGTDSADLFVGNLTKYLSQKIPFLIKLGGHWSVIIGYDDMGHPGDYQNHVLIFADSWDTHDQKQDGYIIYTFDYFWNLWTNAKMRIDGAYQQFVVAYK